MYTISGSKTGLANEASPAKRAANPELNANYRESSSPAAVGHAYRVSKHPNTLRVSTRTGIRATLSAVSPTSRSPRHSGNSDYART
eukprot:644815-Pleurochrysis_carterae.AAC.1